MSRNLILIAIATLFLSGLIGSCTEMKTEKKTQMDTTAQKEVKNAARQTLASWLADGIEGVQFLKESEWKIDEKVLLNSSKNRGCLLLLNQDRDPQAELDYIQILYAGKEDGKWNIYLESMPNLVIPRRKENGRFVPNTISQLAEAGQREIDREYKNGHGKVDDELINRQFNEELKKNHQRFLSRKMKN